MSTTPKATDQSEATGKAAVTDAARHVADTVAGVAGEVGARLPEAANSTREAFGQADRLVHAGSDETLKVVGALSVGFAVGLLIGGAPRVLVLGALAPALLIGTTYIERMNEPLGAAAARRA